MHFCEIRAYEIAACEMRAGLCRCRPMQMHTYEMLAYEGFCEDLARQKAVAHLSQLQLRFRRRHIWVSMLSHMGFSRCGSNTLF